MVGIIIEQHFLPFFQDAFSNCEKFQLSKLEIDVWNEQNRGTKSLVSGLTELIKSKRNQDEESISDIETCLENRKILKIKWRDEDNLIIILSDATILRITLKKLETQVSTSCKLDTFFKNSESAPPIDAAFTNFAVVFLFPDNRLLISRKLENAQSTIENYTDFLPNATTKKMEKKLMLNSPSDILIVWWPGPEVYQWTPRPEQGANLLIYLIKDEPPKLIDFLRTDYKILEIVFLSNNFDIAVLESINDTNDGVICVRESLFEISPLKKLEENSINLNSELRCVAYDSTRSKIAIGCCDSTLLIFLRKGKVTHFTKTAFIPLVVSWHNDSFLIFVAGDKSQCQFFDVALNPILLLHPREALPSISYQLSPLEPIQNMCWSFAEGTPSDSKLLIRFESGAISILRLAMGRIRLRDLINFYLLNNEYQEAINLLKSIQWNSQSCLEAMFSIFGECIKKSHSDIFEYHLEQLLAIYYVPFIPINESVHTRHARSMRVLARRFFMWLLHAKKYARALQIAASLKEENLFIKLIGISNREDVETASEAAIILSKLRESHSESSGSAEDDENDSSQSELDSDHRETEHEETRPPDIPQEIESTPHHSLQRLRQSPENVQSSSTNLNSKPSRIEVIHFGVV